MSMLGITFAAAESQQTAENIVSSSLNERNTVNIQYPVDIGERTQNTIQKEQNAIQTKDNNENNQITTDTGADKKFEDYSTQQSIQTNPPHLNSQNTVTEETNKQNADSSALNNNRNSDDTLTDSMSSEESTQYSTNSEDLQAAAGETYINMRGIWLKAEDASTITVTELKNANITDIFVKANRISVPTYESVLESLIAKFQNSGIRIHAWITCFKDVDGNWIDPASNTQKYFIEFYN